MGKAASKLRRHNKSKSYNSNYDVEAPYYTTQPETQNEEGYESSVEGASASQDHTPTPTVTNSGVSASTSDQDSEQADQLPGDTNQVDIRMIEEDEDHHLDMQCYHNILNSEDTDRLLQQPGEFLIRKTMGGTLMLAAKPQQSGPAQHFAIIREPIPDDESKLGYQLQFDESVTPKSTLFALIYHYFWNPDPFLSKRGIKLQHPITRDVALVHYPTENAMQAAGTSEEREEKLQKLRDQQFQIQPNAALIDRRAAQLV